MPTDISTRPEGLRRDISKFGIAALVFNGLLGAAIFALPAAVASKAGLYGPLMFILCGVLFIPVVLCFAELASYFRETGGPVVYAETAFGPFVGFQTGWLLYLGRVSGLAANSNALVSYGGQLYDGVSGGAGRIMAITVFIAALTWVNVAGVRRGVGTTTVITVLKVIPLLLFVGYGLTFVNPALQLGSPPPPNELAAVLLLVVYAFVGFEGALVPAGESKRPRRDIPRALLATVCITAVLYALVQLVSMAAVPDLASSAAPLADAASNMIGGIGGSVMIAAAFLSIAGNLSAMMVAAPRMTYAMARRKTVPDFLGKTNQTYSTPANSILLFGVLGLVLAVTGSFIWLAIVSSLARLLGYALSIAALPTIRKLHSNENQAFRLRGGLLVPIIAFAVCLFLALQASITSWLATAAFIAAGSVLYYFSRTRGKTVGY